MVSGCRERGLLAEERGGQAEEVACCRGCQRDRCGRISLWRRGYTCILSTPANVGSYLFGRGDTLIFFQHIYSTGCLNGRASMLRLVTQDATRAPCCSHRAHQFAV